MFISQLNRRGCHFLNTLTKSKPNTLNPKEIRVHRRFDKLRMVRYKSENKIKLYSTNIQYVEPDTNIYLDAKNLLDMENLTLKELFNRTIDPLEYEESLNNLFKSALYHEDILFCREIFELSFENRIILHHRTTHRLFDILAKKSLSQIIKFIESKMTDFNDATTDRKSVV